MILLKALFFVSLTFGINGEEKKAKSDNFLLVISLDGFRYDYLDKYSRKEGFLNQLANKGVRAAWSESIFPTNTYPNHWSIVTGLYPENTGIINNDIYDPSRDKVFRMYVNDESEDGWFQEAEPLWVTNARLNKKHSVVFDWPGGAAKFSNFTDYTYRHPSIQLFSSLTFNKTIDDFIEKIDADRTNLGVLYFGEPDLSGHMFGPESDEVRQVVIELDFILDYLFEQLKVKKNLALEQNEKSEFREIDLVILTDHGMQTIRDKHTEHNLDRLFLIPRILDVKKLINLEKSTFGSVCEIWPLEADNEEMINQIYYTLKTAIEESNFKQVKNIYLKKDIPERFYLKAHERTAPILLLAQEGCQIIIDEERGKAYSYYHGNHGFDPETQSMRGIFLAHGNSFKKSYYSKRPVKIIDIYPLLCSLLKFQPNSHNGSFDRISGLLNEEFLGSVKVNMSLKMRKKDEVEAVEDEQWFQFMLFAGLLVILGLILVSVIVPFIYPEVPRKRQSQAKTNPQLIRKDQ